ncbi:MAG: hypothetical protein FWG56_09860, partial [Desulfovibrionaceae bacterium]|nr:hypothetical protein [Desulfovibrionaceae bacterium]
IRFIRCDLLDGSSGQWGHKPLEESMHPYYSGCCHMNFVCCAHRWAMRPTMTNTRSHQPGWAHDRDSGVCRHSFLPESS